ncbi:MAG: hypothetical protein H0V09_00800 [Gemmatimonadetes bacterium]|nr:hypothetical protein [Gemmatimonadota bacterium]
MRARRAAQETATLLRHLELPVDVEEGWARLKAVAACGEGPRHSRGPWLVLAAGFAAAVIGVVQLTSSPHAALPDADSLAAAPAVRDLCCWDLDGGGPGDDGVVTVSVSERILSLTLYEDGNASGDLTPGDVLRFAGSPLKGGSAAQYSSDRTLASSGLRVRDVCCSDHDGGGHDDDGILTLSPTGGEKVDRVLLYEDEDRTRSFSTGDSLRWHGTGPSEGI